MKHFVSLALSVCLFSACQTSQVQKYALVPEPQEIVYEPGFCRLEACPLIAYPAALQPEARLLQTYLSADFGMQPVLGENKEKGNIVLKVDTAWLPEQPEGYVLTVGSRRIELAASTSEGIFRGIQTLRQLIGGEAGKREVQRGRITDYPAFPWRAFMLDEGRYFKGKETVCRLLDEMARLKMNVFHWHLTDDQGWRIEIEKYSALTAVGSRRDSSEINHFHSDVFDGKPHGGFYTREEVREIVRYAAARHITVVPEIEMPGHASAAIAAYPWLGTSGEPIPVPGKFGVHTAVYNVADPKVIGFLNDVLDEVIALFPSSVIHIGGDEVRYDAWKKSPVVRRYMAQNGLKTPAELQVFFTNRISNLLAEKNRRMMGWNEITGARLHEYQGAEDAGSRRQLAPGTIVHFWKGDNRLIEQAVDQGLDVVNSNNLFTYLDYDYRSIPLEKAYGFNPVPAGFPKEKADKIIGSGCQLWCEFVPDDQKLNVQVFPRLAAYAETGWTDPEKKNYARFLKALEPLRQRWEAAGIQTGPVE